MESLLVLLLILIVVFVLISVLPIDSNGKLLLYVVAAIGAIVYLLLGRPH